MVWRTAGMGWPEEGPVLRWVGEERVSPLSFGTKECGAEERGAEVSGEVREPGQGGAARVTTYGRSIAFRVVGERRCVGVRGNPCPLSAVIAQGRATRAQCAECAQLDRSRSVAADTMADDPRPYAVYLAWFGPGLVKVGITREDRGAARLREQGAVAFSWLGRGPLMAARRCEELLRAALGVPDRISYVRKRAVRGALPGPGERAAEVRELHERSVRLMGWPEALERVACVVVDLVGVYGLDAVQGDGRGGEAGGGGRTEVTGVIGELVTGGSVAGRVVAVAGPDVYLEAGGEVVVLDSRLMEGWELGRGDAGGGVTVPVKGVEGRGAGVQDGLF
ncbi:DUF2797 domain-containing protein [Streptomyces sp. NPDC051561]|uniref:DUF2797 domain-containing protein n=1 Tax=Streptomyces sp. NPDC051561 TaxID=3365658 RepID=UPI0037A772F7